jgi:hypothetical protein
MFYLKPTRHIPTLPIATGLSERQVRPCPLCPESGSKLAMQLRVDGDALDVISSQRPIEKGAISENLAQTLSRRCAGEAVGKCAPGG